MVLYSCCVVLYPRALKKNLETMLDTHSKWVMMWVMLNVLPVDGLISSRRSSCLKLQWLYSVHGGGFRYFRSDRLEQVHTNKHISRLTVDDAKFFAYVIHINDSDIQGKI